MASSQEPNLIVSTTAGDLVALLGSTIPFAGDEYDHPLLAGIRLDAGDSVLSATTTNRYVCGHARRKASGTWPGPVVIPRRQARRLRRALSAELETRGDGYALATLAYDAEKNLLVVEFCDVTMRVKAVQAAESDTEREIYSKVEKILAELPTVRTEGSYAPTAFAPYAIRPFLKAAKYASNSSSTPLRWCVASKLGPARVEIEDWFVGAIMPVAVSPAYGAHVQADFPTYSAAEPHEPEIGG
jgi:hypothetical protein